MLCTKILSSVFNLININKYNSLSVLIFLLQIMIFLIETYFIVLTYFLIWRKFTNLSALCVN